MADSEQIARSKLYSEIMGEIRIRIDCIDTGTSNRIPIPPPMVQEFCYLQFRYICELIALACLVAHGDITANNKKRFEKMYKADEIVNELGRLHPDFYPKHVKYKINPGPPGPGNIEILEPDTQPLTKKELLELYSKCGDSLHKGNLRQLMSGSRQMSQNYPRTTASAQRILNLINSHLISMKKNDFHYLCMATQTGNQITYNVVIAESPQYVEPLSSFDAP